MTPGERYFYINTSLPAGNNHIDVDVHRHKPNSERSSILKKNFLKSFSLQPPNRLFFTGIPNEEHYLTSSDQYLEQMKSGLKQLNEYEEFYITPDPLKQENLPDTFKHIGLRLAVKCVYEDNYMMKLVDPATMHHSSYGVYSFNLHRGKNYIKITSGANNMRPDLLTRFITLMAPLEQAFSQSIADISNQPVLRELKTNRKSTRIYRIIGPTLGYVNIDQDDNNHNIWEKYFYPNP